jgi:hypothetical protein
MKMKVSIVLSVLLACFLWVHGALAETYGYQDETYNPVTLTGVLGVEYHGTNGIAIAGINTTQGPGGFFLTQGTGGASAGVEGFAMASEGDTYGGYFGNSSSSGTGVFAKATASSGVTYGGYFSSDSNDGTGVFAKATASSGETYGGAFRSDSNGGIGVAGEATASSGETYGGAFRSDSNGGIGVAGHALATSGTTYGGIFRSFSTSGTGIWGLAKATSGVTNGGYFESYSTKGRGVYGWAIAVSGTTYGGYFKSDSRSGRGVAGLASSTSGTNYGLYGETKSPSGYGVYSKGNLKVVGNQTVTGTKSAVVKLKNGEGITLYAVEASENWFEDFGSSRLKAGETVVEIDPTYAETVNTEVDYHVFLTPRGECKGLYVANQKGTSFEVRELNGGRSDISFSYRIVAKRKGYEDLRLVKVEEEMTTAMAAVEDDIQGVAAMDVASNAK